MALYLHSHSPELANVVKVLSRVLSQMHHNLKRRSWQVRLFTVFFTMWDKYSLMAYRMIPGGLQAWP